jgi:hypothetical protein
MGGGGARRPGRPARRIRRPEGPRGGRIHTPSSAARPWPDLGGGRGEPGARGHPFAHVVPCRAPCAGRGAPLRQGETEARPDDAELRDDDEHLRQLRDTRSSCCFARDSVLLRQASSRRRGHPFSSPFLCSVREVVGGRGRWWASRRLQESRHRGKSEGGGGRRDFRVVDPVPRCRLDSGKIPHETDGGMDPVPRCGWS